MIPSAIVLFAIVAVASVPKASAQSYEEFRASMGGEAQQQAQAFNDYKAAENKRFHSFLKQQWREFRLFKGQPEDPTPKPVRIPQAREVEPPTGEVVRPRVPPVPKSRPVVVKPPVSSGQKLSSNFYGQDLQWRIPEAWGRWHQKRLPKIDNKAIADYWQAFSNLDPKPLLEQIKNIARALGLNGWGRMLLTHHLAQNLKLDSNRALLTSWALLNKASKDVRTAYSKGRVHMLFNSDQPLYDVSFFNLSDKRYYLFNPENNKKRVTKVSTYKGQLSDRLEPVDLRITTAPRMLGKAAEKTFNVDWEGKSYRFKAPVHKPLVGFMATLPQQKIDGYFEFSPNEALGSVLLPQIKESIAGLDATIAVNFLLRFVQQAFEYATDDKQFRQENYLLPEETLYYPASDCEDRSILFAWLVRKVLKLDVVGLDYPGHVATAVHLPGAKGKRYNSNGKSYVVADPTYINAKVGQEMPRFAAKPARIIPIPH